MTNTDRTLAIAVDQAGLWTATKLINVRPKIYKGEVKLRNGVPLYGVEILGFLTSLNKKQGRGADFANVSVPLTDGEFQKLSSEKADTLLSFSGLVVYYIDGRQHFVADSVAVIRNLPTSPTLNK